MTEIVTHPYDPQYPAGYFKSMSITITLPPGSSGGYDVHLGGGWASFNLGGYTQTWEFNKAAGFSPRYFRKNPSEDWPPATLSSP